MKTIDGFLVTRREKISFYKISNRDLVELKDNMPETEKPCWPNMFLNVDLTKPDELLRRALTILTAGLVLQLNPQTQSKQFKSLVNGLINDYVIEVIWANFNFIDLMNEFKLYGSYASIDDDQPNVIESILNIHLPVSNVSINDLLENAKFDQSVIRLPIMVNLKPVGIAAAIYFGGFTKDVAIYLALNLAQNIGPLYTKNDGDVVYAGEVALDLFFIGETIKLLHRIFPFLCLEFLLKYFLAVKAVYSAYKASQRIKNIDYHTTILATEGADTPLETDIDDLLSDMLIIDGKIDEILARISRGTSGLW